MRHLSDLSKFKHIVAYLILVAVLAFVISKVSTTQDQLAATQRLLHDNVASQLDNRVGNVASWCGAINANRTESRILFERKGLHYSLPNLNCTQLEAKTRASAK
jgi:hypothetical protein